MKAVNIKIVSIVAVLTIASCCSNKCIPDKDFVDSYNYRLHIIEAEYIGKDSINIEEYGHTLIYFSKIAGYLPRAEYGSTIGYRNKEFYKEDMTKLKAWLKNNKCQFTKRKADSILLAAGYPSLITK